MLNHVLLIRAAVLIAVGVRFDPKRIAVLPQCVYRYGVDLDDRLTVPMTTAAAYRDDASVVHLLNVVGNTRIYRDRMPTVKDSLMIAPDNVDNALSTPFTHFAMSFLSCRVRMATS